MVITKQVQSTLCFQVPTRFNLTATVRDGLLSKKTPGIPPKAIKLLTFESVAMELLKLYTEASV
jgi:hypothetical protein